MLLYFVMRSCRFNLSINTVCYAPILNSDRLNFACLIDITLQIRSIDDEILLSRTLEVLIFGRPFIMSFDCITASGISNTVFISAPEKILR